MNCETVRLWEKPGQPGFSGVYSDAFLQTYLLEGNKKRAAVMICPGGGYSEIALKETEPVARRFNAAGMNAIVLHYSVSPARHPQPLLDASRAMALLRLNVDEWRIDARKIAVCGFSAGGHLAASLGLFWNDGEIRNVSGAQAGQNRPDAMILCYPVITSRQFAHAPSFQCLLGDHPYCGDLTMMSLELQVNEQTPPVFLWHTLEDQRVPVENSLLFAGALRRKGIPFELHIFQKGPHGLSVASEDMVGSQSGVTQWMELCLRWLKETLGA